MKIRYVFVNGEVSEIEVEETLGSLLLELDRQEANNTRAETRRHVSLSELSYEGGCSTQGSTCRKRSGRGFPQKRCGRPCKNFRLRSGN